MMIWTTRFSRKRAAFAVMFMGLVMGLLIVLMGRIPEEEPSPLPQLSDNAARIAYLESFGWQVSEEPVETLQFLLPQPLSEPYLSYNALQLAQGFDLTPYCGQQLCRCTYIVENYPGRAAGVQANLYLCEDQPVAGDILCTGAEGFQASLRFPQSGE